MFDECDDIFINGYDEKIKFKEFETHIKSHFLKSDRITD